MPITVGKDLCNFLLDLDQRRIVPELPEDLFSQCGKGKVAGWSRTTLEFRSGPMNDWQ
ncbi:MULTISPECIES: hypothetical protein [Sphingobacterium]|uniref:hypothetical protein n=1 Tax=Sphingobacterium TaxID=28453 RepID=UPI0016253818|nr:MULTISPECIES: hypothetical protein [Sphingobacterium]MBV2228234.1 hypothetical protein [Sphingobacterium mizutaii]